jgi:hypothetical protein
MTKRQPRTGEKRKRRQPLSVDKLGQTVHDAIFYLRNRLGLTWIEIEERSARPYSEKWKDDDGGFIDWSSVDLKVLELFPNLRVPHSNLHRWYDIRVEQVRAQVLTESEGARAFAAAFARADLSDANSAVVNALRDQVFDLIQSAGQGDKAIFIKGLQNLTLAMTRMQRVELQAKRVEVDERKLAQIEQDAELKRRKFEREMNAAEKKITRGEALTSEDIDRIRERVFGIGPKRVG